MTNSNVSRVEGRKIVGRHASWDLLESPHRNGNTTKTMGEAEGYLASAICSMPGMAPKKVVLHVPADLALAWFMANDVPTLGQ